MKVILKSTVCSWTKMIAHVQRAPTRSWELC